MARKRGGLWKWLLGGVAVGGGIAVLLSTRKAKAAPIAISVKVRRGRRAVWEGTGEPPATLQPRPKYGAGAMVSVIPAGPDGTPSGLDAKPHKVVSRKASELVEYPTGDLAKGVPVPGAALTWTYTLADDIGEIAEDWIKQG